MTRCSTWAAWTATVVLAATFSSASAGDGNRLAGLDENAPWAHSHRSPKLVTPQWVGEPGVEAVITLGIDDMRDPAVYEKYLRPILTRLKQIDGRAPVSIFTCKVDPTAAQLQTWLEEGLSFEVHTTNHPCPLLCKSDFAAAKRTYDECIDLLAKIPGTRPVAYRMPCCDSLNTLSPRFYGSVFDLPTADRNFLQMSSSVFTLFTANDPSHPRDLVVDEQGAERFRKLIPKGVKAMGKSTERFFNWIEDYPYPFVVNRLCWEFPCMVPSDWSAQFHRGVDHAETVADWKRALDLTVRKQGVFNLVYHPHNWIKPEQVVELIEYAQSTYGARVKFLTFKDALQRINQNLLDGHPLRADNGQDNGIRILDVNADGYMDVVIGCEQLGRTKVWQPQTKTWQISDFPTKFIQVDRNGKHHDAQARFGIVQKNGFATVAVSTSSTRRAWDFDGERWQPNLPLRQLFTENADRASSGELGGDLGMRFRDLDGDGLCEIVAANPTHRTMWGFDAETGNWVDRGWTIPEALVVADRVGRDVGTRFVDLNDDGGLDLVVSNEKQCGIWLFQDTKHGWGPAVFRHDRSDPAANARLPAITVDGVNEGWAAVRGEMVWQNERTDQMTDLVDRRAFVDLIAPANGIPGPKSAAASLNSMRTAPGYVVELMAAEPLVTDPVAMQWGADGRLWVAEMRDYPRGCPEGGRVRVLTDRDGDGDYDEAVTFLEGIAFPTGIFPWRDGAIISAAPDVIFARDTNGDGTADERTVLLAGFAEGNQQHRVNGPVWSLDGRLHFANGDSGGVIKSPESGESIDIRGRDLSLDPATGSLRAETGQTQFGRNRDSFGLWFGNNNSNPLYQYVLEDRYLGRNPHATAPAVRVDVPELAGNAPVFPLSRTLTRFNDFHTANRLTSACSSTLYRDRLFGAESSAMFVCEPVHNLVHREQLSEVDGLYRSRRFPGETSSEFLASTDNWFRPVYVTTGPDGCVWVADMYRLVIEHPEWIPKDWQERLDLRSGHDRGRIYRVRPLISQPGAVPNLTSLSGAALAARLETANGWQRDTVQRLLRERKDMAAVPEVRRLASQGRSAEARASALWTLELLGVMRSEDAATALGDPDPRVARQAVVLLERHTDWLGSTSPALRKLPGREVRLDRQLACSIGEWSKSDQEEIRVLSAELFGDLALRSGGDRFVAAGLLSSLDGRLASAVLERLARPGAADQVAEASRRQDWIVTLLEQATAFGAETGPERLFQLLVVDGGDSSGGDSLQRALRFFELAGRRPALAAWYRNGLKGDQKSVVETTQKLRAACSRLLAESKGDVAPRVIAARCLGQSLALEGTDVAADSARSDIIPLLWARSPESLQAAAVEVLGGWTGLQASIAERWSQLTPARRSQLIDAWLATGPGRDGLERLMAAGNPAAHDLTAAQRQLWIERTPREARPRIRELCEGSGEATARAEVVLSAIKGIADKQPEAAAGAAVFQKACAACHRFGGVGQEVGPDIASLTDRSPEALLTAILDPNRAVEAKYLQFTAETTAGLTVSGMISAETAGSLTLRQSDGKELVLSRDEISELAGTGRSLMPEGLEKDLSASDLANLVAHLRSGAAPVRREFAGNQPRLIVPEPGGHLRLSAEAASIFGSAVVFEQKYGNLGYWSGAADRAEWMFRLPKEGRYRVVLDWACPDDTAGNGWVIEFRGQRLSGTVSETGSWDTYRRQSVGEVNCAAGEQSLSVRSSGPIVGNLWDLRAIVLEPIRE